MKTKKLLATAALAMLSSTSAMGAEPLAGDSTLTAPATTADATEDKEKTEKNLAWLASKVRERVRIFGYAQGGYTATLPESGNPDNSFDLKRVVLMIEAKLTKQFMAFFMHEFKTGSVQEYYLEYRPMKALNARVGQSKIELSIENPISPTVLESISPMSQGVYWLCGYDPLMGNPSGRDLGLMLYGTFLHDKLYYMVEMVNGGVINTSDKNNQKNFIGKIEYRPSSQLRFSVSGQLGHGYAVATSDYNTGVALGETYRQNRYAVGLEWKSKPTGNDYFKHRCASVRAEWLGGHDKDVDSRGGYVATTVPVYKQLDAVATVDYFDYNTTRHLEKTNLTVGMQYWFLTKCRLQAQYTYSARSGAMKELQGSNCHQILAQVQVNL